MNAFVVPASAGKPGRAPLKGRTQRVVAAALVIAVTVAAAWYGWTFYQTIPLRNLPDVDLSQATPAVRSAILEARRAVVAAPRSGSAWGKLGLCLQAHQFYNPAAVCLAEAMRLEPREVLWTYNRGSILSISNQSESERCFRQVAELRPDLALPHLRLGELFLEQRRLNDAEAEFREGIRIEPESARAMLGLGLVAFSRGDIDAAGRWAEKAFARDPERRTTAELLLRVYYRQGNTAAEVRQQAIVDRLPQRGGGWNDPFDEKVVRLRRDPLGLADVAIQLFNNGQSSEATGMLEQLVSELPDDSQIHVALATSFSQQGAYQQAAQILDSVLSRHPDWAEIRFERGRVYFLEKQWESAAAEFKRAIELKPDYGDAYLGLGRIFAQLNDRAAAIAALREAVRFRPNSAEAYTELGRLLLEDGQREAAREALETAARLSPDDRQTQELLERLK